MKHLTRLRRRPADEGAAMLIVVLVLAVLTGIGSTLVVLTTNNLQSASRDRQAAGALATADAGIAQALEYIRLNGAGAITCLETDVATTVTTNPCYANPAGFTSPRTPQTVNIDGGSTCAATSTCYRTYVTAVRRYNPPSVKQGIYRIHSRGVFGSDPGARAVSVDVEVTPANLPIGVFGKELDGNGGTRLYSISLFTTDCVSPRYDGSGNGTRFSGTLDPYWDIPAAANSTSEVSTANNCGTSGNIHSSTVCPTSAELRYDRDSQGGPLPVGSPCASFVNGQGVTQTRTTTRFTYDDLKSYGYRPGGLTDKQYEVLRSRAATLGTLNAPVTSLATLLQNAVNAGVSSPVVYYDNLTSTQNLSFRASDIPAAFARVPGVASTCTPRSVLVIVRNGGVVYQSGNSDWRTMSILVPEGSYRGNGGYNVLGTLFANNLSLGGNEQFSLDDCFVDNLPGGLLDLDVVSFREEDRTDVL